jgi:hypothetical protein
VFECQKWVGGQEDKVEKHYLYFDQGKYMPKSF